MSLPSTKKRRLENDSPLCFASGSSWYVKLSPIACYLKQSGQMNHGSWKKESDFMVVRATAESAAAAESPKSNSFTDAMVLATLFGLWIVFNIYFNIYNEQVFKAFPYPVTVSLGKFAFGTAIIILMWTFNLHKRPKISASQLAAILPLAAVHTLGNLFTDVVLEKFLFHSLTPLKLWSLSSQLSSLLCFLASFLQYG